MSLYGTYKNTLFRKNHRECKQLRLEKHLTKHPTDYQSVIANEKLKSEVHWLEYKLVQITKEMEADGQEY